MIPMSWAMNLSDDLHKNAYALEYRRTSGKQNLVKVSRMYAMGAVLFLVDGFAI